MPVKKLRYLLMVALLAMALGLVACGSDDSSSDDSNGSGGTIEKNTANGDTPTPAIKEGIRNDPGVYPPPEVLTKLHPEPMRTPDFTRVLTRMWTRFKTGK